MLGSINVERFVPQKHKLLQWYVVPDTLIVVGNGLHMENQALHDWLHNPSFRRSSYDLKFVNMLQFIPSFTQLFQDFKKKILTYGYTLNKLPTFCSIHKTFEISS